MVHRKPEENLILLLSGVNPSPEILEEAKDLMTNKGYPVDYDRMFRLAGSNEVLSLLYHNLKDTDTAPDYIKKKLNNAYLHILRNNVAQAEEALKIFALLKKNRVKAIPLKGVVASELIFGDPGLYLSTDIDILVRPEDLVGVAGILLGAGYEKDAGISGNDLISSHYHLIFQKNKHYVEVHWNLVKRYFQIPPEFWWEDVHKTGYEGIEITELSAERYIMYTVFRLFDHGFRPLKFFVLISEIINRYRDDIGWGELLTFSRRYKMERLVLFTLRLVHDVLGTDIPATVTKKNIIGYEVLKKKIISDLFHQVTRPHLRMFLYYSLLDNPMEYAKIISRRFFPEMSEIRLRYGLPVGSKKAYAYYLLNPLLVLMKK
jgi:Uncharacterised nucleotidyltransferase